MRVSHDGHYFQHDGPAADDPDTIHESLSSGMDWIWTSHAIDPYLGEGLCENDPADCPAKQ